MKTLDDFRLRSDLEAACLHLVDKALKTKNTSDRHIVLTVFGRMWDHSLSLEDVVAMTALMAGNYLSTGDCHNVLTELVKEGTLRELRMGGRYQFRTHYELNINAEDLPS